MIGRRRALVAGTVAAAAAHGGATWAVLQYAIGLSQLGMDCYLVERLVQPTAEIGDRFSVLLSRFDLRGEIVDDTHEFRDFDLVMNLSGALPAESIAAIPVRVYVDLP